jgi:hypothetical protein
VSSTAAAPYVQESRCSARRALRMGTGQTGLAVIFVGGVVKVRQRVANTLGSPLLLTMTERSDHGTDPGLDGP